MEQTLEFTRNPKELKGAGRVGRGPSGQHVLWAMIFVPVGVIVAAGGIGLALWEFGLLPAPAQTGIPTGTMLCLAGVVFLLGLGFVLMFRGDLRWLFKRGRFDPSQPWLYDYSWNPREFRSSSWGEVLSGLYLLVFCALLTPPALALAAADSRGFILVVFAGLGLLVCGYLFIKAVLQHLKYGDTWVRFQQFPYHPGERIVLGWGTQRGFNPYNWIKFTLRYVEEERRTRRGRDGIEHISYYPIEIWANSFTMEEDDRFTPKREQGRAFDVPADAPSTHLRGDPPSYWELEVEVDAPGVNFQRTYGVPIYQRPPQQWTQEAAAG